MVKNVLIAVFGITSVISSVVVVDNWELYQRRKECKKFLAMVNKNAGLIEDEKKHSLTEGNSKRLVSPCDSAKRYALDFRYQQPPSPASFENEMFFVKIPNSELAGLLYDRDISSHTFAIMGRKWDNGIQRNCIILCRQKADLFERETQYYEHLHETFPVVKYINQTDANAINAFFNCP